nr:magnesium transporter [Halorhodospira halophila]
MVETFTKLYLRGSWRPLERLIRRLHAADAAAVLVELPVPQVVDTLQAVSDLRHAAQIVNKMPLAIRHQIVEALPHKDLAELLENFRPDDLTDLIQALPDEQRDHPLSALDAESRSELDTLLAHDPGSAGGIMTTEFFSLPEACTVQEAIEALRGYADAEMVFYLFLTGEEGRLTGVISLRQLLLAPSDAQVADVMSGRVIRVRTDTEEEQVSRLFDKYRLLALPVVDDNDVLVGIITVDDIIDVIGESTTEDMLRMAGTRQSEMLTDSVFRIAGVRLPWLFAAFLGGLGATAVIGQYEEVLAQVIILSAFVPIIIGMAGNVGVQSATVTVRGLATGAINPRDTLVMVFKELRVGLLLGAFYGVILAAYGFWVYDSLQLGQVVGLTILTNMTGAALLAVSLPMLFVRLKADPAVATGPFVTTAIDVLGVLNYFAIASLIYGL